MKTLTKEQLSKLTPIITGRALRIPFMNALAKLEEGKAVFFDFDEMEEFGYTMKNLNHLYKAINRQITKARGLWYKAMRGKTLGYSRYNNGVAFFLADEHGNII